jgi:hypothetical protein
MSVDTPRMIPVMSGRVCAGFLISTAHGVAAYDRAERPLGIFSDVISAAAAIEKSLAMACPGCAG